MNSYNESFAMGLRANIQKLPRETFCCLPTPLMYLKQLSIALGGVNIWIKRDDLTGIGIGGNKNRKLEFIIADAMEKGATDIITQGATQTNHGCQTSGIAAKYGMKCHLLLENRRMNKEDEYLKSGNIFLSKILNTKLYHFDAHTDMNKKMEKMAKYMRSVSGLEKNRYLSCVPYIIPGGASNARGAIGYVNCALEIIQQANEKNLKIDYIVTATGSSGTQAGLAVGMKIIESPIKVLGIGTNAFLFLQTYKILQLSQKIMEFLNYAVSIEDKDILVNCDYIGTGYGNPTDKTIEAIKMLARLEGIFLDPTYTGKAMAGLIDLVEKGEFKKGDNIVFLHTGGQSSLWAYKKYFL